MKLSTIAIVGLSVFAGLVIQWHKDQPTIIRHGSEWVMPHVPLPACPDDHVRRVVVPERDEVDMLEVSCRVR